MCFMASRASQSTVDTILKIVGKMLIGVAPCDTMKTGGKVYTAAWARLKFFVREEVAGGASVFGTEALEIKFNRLSDTIKKEQRTAKLFELDIFKASIYCTALYDVLYAHA
jgi:hypothetical protein